METMNAPLKRSIRYKNRTKNKLVGNLTLSLIQQFMLNLTYLRLHVYIFVGLFSTLPQKNFFVIAMCNNYRYIL